MILGMRRPALPAFLSSLTSPSAAVLSATLRSCTTQRHTVESAVRQHQQLSKGYCQAPRQVMPQVYHWAEPSSVPVVLVLGTHQGQLAACSATATKLPHTSTGWSFGAMSYILTGAGVPMKCCHLWQARLPCDDTGSEGRAGFPAHRARCAHLELVVGGPVIGEPGRQEEECHPLNRAQEVLLRGPEHTQ